MFSLGGNYVFAVAETGDDARLFVVGPDGRSYDPTEVLVAETQARRDQIGKLTPELVDHIADLSDDSLVDVSFMVAGDFIEPEFPNDGTDVDVPLAEFEAWLMAHRAAQRERLASAKARLLGAIPIAGGEILSDVSELPFFHARVPAALLRSPEIDEASDIARIREIDTTAAPLLGYAGQGSWNDQLMVNGAGQPLDGGDVQVGLWEQTDSTAIALQNGRYANATAIYQPIPNYSNPKDCSACLGSGNEVCVNNVCVGKHISWVAASIGMYGSYTYTDDNAPGVTFPTSPPGGTTSGAWNVNYTVGSTNNEVGINYILLHPVVFLNHSQASGGGDTDDALNWAARYQLTVVTQASGNTDTGWVTCGAQWNTLCVGAYAYNTWNQPSTHRRWYLSASSASSYLNGPAIPGNEFPADVERPHVLGPGTYASNNGLHMPDVGSAGNAMVSIDQGTMIKGTSFSSPAVLGVAIKVIGDEGFFSPAFHPTTLKAIIMAGTRDSEADGAIGNNNSSWNSSADFEDGTGHPDYWFVKQITWGNRYWKGNLTNSSFVSCGTNCREYTGHDRHDSDELKHQDRDGLPRLHAARVDAIRPPNARP